MKIGIDASRAFAKNRTGIEEYSYQLIRSLTMMDTGAHQVFLYSRPNPTIDFKLPGNFVLKEIKHKLFWTQIGLSLELRRNPVEVLFIPSYAVPFIHPKKTVVTVHGLEYKSCPECYPWKERTILELNTRFSVRRAKRIVVPSENTKKDLAKCYRVDPERVIVINHGVERRMGNIESGILNIENKKNPDEFNILSVGRTEKRKNIINLVKAFEIFRDNFGGNDSLKTKNYKLVLAGSPGFGFEEIKKEVGKSKYKKDIILKGYVPPEEKDKLYRGADVFVMPSFYEGFGLPVLEAMGYGVPVICSNASSLPEIANNAAVLIDPDNIEEISRAILKITADEKFRSNLIKKGLENAKKFEWKECAARTWEILVAA